MDNRQDGFINTVIGHGLHSRDPFASYKFSRNNFMSDQELDDLYTYNGIANKIISAPANEALRAGFKLMDGETELEENDAVISVLEDLAGFKNLATALSWDRLYGGCAVLIMADDGGTLEDPLNEGRIRSLEKLEVFEAPEVQVNDGYIYSDPRDPNFGEPQYYTLIGYNGNSFLCHESRLLLFKGSTISMRIRRARNGWGGRAIDQVRQDIINYDSSLSLSLMLLSRLSQGVLKLQGMNSLLQSDFGEKQVTRRLQLIDMARHLMNTLALDTEDDYDQKNITVSGVKDIVEQFQIALSASTGIPATVLFGRSPAGENATGEADMENYYNMVARIQQRSLRPQLGRLIDLIGKASEYGIRLPQKYTIKFNPLWLPSEKEEAETANIKGQAKEHEANAAKTYIDMGALDAQEVRSKLDDGDDYNIDSSLDKVLNTPVDAGTPSNMPPGGDDG